MSNARFGLRVRNGLVRSITEGIAAIDSDVFAFITAAGITDTTQFNAINQLVIDLKNFGLWTKMKAIYPFVGGTASAHKFNLKNSLDTNAAFRLVFNGGWTHSGNGALPNGTNAYADTFLSPSAILSQNNVSMGLYSGTSTSQNGVAMGSSNAISFLRLWPSIPSFGIYADMNDGSNTSLPNLDGSGFLFGYRTSGTQKKISRRGSIFTLNENSNGINSFSVYLAASNLSGNPNAYSNYQHRFSFIGDGLTDTEAANLHTTVQAFQTTLGRL